MLILDLPTEVILMVLDYVRDPLDGVDLREVCEMFNAIIKYRLSNEHATDCRRLDKKFRRLGFHTCSHCGQVPTHRDFVTHHRTQLEHQAKILFAASNNYLRFGRYLLERQPPSLLSDGHIHVRDFKRWMQGVTDCSKSGYTDMLRLMLAFPPRRPSDLNWTWLNRNPVYRAVERNDIEQAEMLIDAGLPVNDISAELHVTVVWLAVSQHNPSLVRLLLARGTTVHVRHPAPDLQAHPLLAACTGSGEMRGWFPRLIRLLLRRVTPATLGLMKVNRLQALAHPSLGLNVGDPALHCIAKSSQRACGLECAEVMDHGTGQLRLGNEREVWDMLLAAGVNAGDLNRAGKPAIKTLMELRAMRRRQSQA